MPDWLAPGLRIVSVGINPSLPSARHGFPFANPRNRFWPALNASGLLAAPVTPGVDAMNVLLARDGIGFTDVVKRASAMEKDIDREAFRAGAGVLLEKLRAYRPQLVWLHGKTPLNALFRAAGATPGGEWGLQPATIEGIRVFVTPNPSPANAAFTLDAITGWYRRVAENVAG
ncbi:MAG TPA: mismatch-specific DNA-glycosylase [Gammaproteobacteria bacterium]